MQISPTYDVIVVGGGSTGVVAATQAALAGARTLLIEKTGMLGGTTTSAGVNFPGLFHAWGKQIIGGIGWEITEKAVNEAGNELPDFTDYKQRHWKLQIPINVFLLAAICDKTLVNAGADVLFHCMPAKADFERTNKKWTLTICAKTGLKQIQAHTLIDTTGDANLTALAHFPLNVSEELQPATLSCIASGYDLDAIDFEQINQAFEAEVQAGNLSYTDASWNTSKASVQSWLSKYGNNARTSEDRSTLELKARKSLLGLYRFLRKQPGLENLTINQLCTECGVRETATIQGKKTVTVEDYTSGKLWDDAVCHSFYPIDLHVSSGKGLDCRPLEEGVVPTIPRGAMLPAGSQQFIVAGRCISSDRLANSALRVQASCMAMGQAVGAMGALSAHQNTDPETLSIRDIHDLLKAHNAIVPQLD